MDIEENVNVKNTSKMHTQEDIDKVVNIWLDVIKTPSITWGQLLEDEHFINVSTRWSVMDVTKNARPTFHKSFSILKSSLPLGKDDKVIQRGSIIVNESGCIPVDGKAICTYKDGNLKAILVERKSQNGSSDRTNSELLQIWDGMTLFKTFDLKELDKHKSVYYAGRFGSTMNWSQNGKKLAYLAEKKIPKQNPFFTSYVKKDVEVNLNEDGKENTGDMKGEEYSFKQTWGEQLKNMYYSVIVILDIETDTFEVIDLPEDEFPIDIQWVNNVSIVGNSYKMPVWRMGLSFCTNRESRIFQVDIDGNNLTFLSQEGRAVMCPRVRPDGKFVIWQERAVNLPHRRAMAIMGSRLGDTKEINTQVCLYEASPDNEIPMYQDFFQSCWNHDGSEFFVITPSNGIFTLLSLSLEPEESKSPAFVNWIFDDIGVDSILSVGNNFMLISTSSCLTPPSLELLEFSSSCKSSPRRVIISKEKSTVTNTDNTIKREFVFGESTAPSIYLGPEINSVESKSIPLIVIAHGGPHSVFADCFTHETIFFLRLGFAVLKINYIGSIGTRQDETDKLSGLVGILDVKDCQNIAEMVVKTHPTIDPNNIFTLGGSHGGFLSAHLTSSFPGFYKAAAIRNPVCNMITKLGTSDITGWGLSEISPQSVADDNSTLILHKNSLEEAERCIKCSPITYASNVQAPTLLFISTEDQRVHMSQGLSYYRALKSFNKLAELRVYPDNHSQATPSVLTDVMIHTGLWFRKFMD